MRASPGARRRRSSPRSGITLIELLVVVALVAIVLGAGMALISALGSNTGAESAAGAVRALLSGARSRAQAAARTTMVILDHEGHRVIPLAEKTVGLWHFEPGESADSPREAPGFRGRVFNLVNDARLILDGRVGGALELWQPEDSAECPTAAAFVFPEGFRLSCDVMWPTYLDEEGLPVDVEGTIVEKIGDFRLAIEMMDIGHRLAPFFAAEVEDYSVLSVDEVEHDRWYRLELLHDTRQVRFFVDGREQPPDPDQDDPRAVVMDPDVSTLCLGDGPGGYGAQSFAGAIDELRLAALSADSERLQLSEGLRLAPISARPWTPAPAAPLITAAPGSVGAGVSGRAGPSETLIVFDASGALDPRFHDAPVVFEIAPRDRKARGRRQRITVTMMGLVQ